MFPVACVAWGTASVAKVDAEMKLSQRLSAVMIAAALAVAGLSVVGFWAFYGYQQLHNPALVDAKRVWPVTEEWVWLAATVLAAVMLAMALASGMARRIVAPMEEVAANLRRVASGDLAARVTLRGGNSLEARQLADDFNTMADRLESMENARVFWNAAIAHELRTPVTVLRGRLQGIRDGVFEADREQLSHVLRSVEGLSRLVEDLRVVGLADGGHLTLDTRRVVVATEVSSVVGIMESSMRAAGHVVMMDLESFEAQVDPVRVRQLLLALLDNARKHALPGPVRVTLSRQSTNIVLEVTDSGPGIIESERMRIFDAFRSTNTESAASGGSGLGLAVVKAIAEAHEGAVECVASAEGGAIFRVSLPTYTESQDEPE